MKNNGVISWRKWREAAASIKHDVREGDVKESIKYNNGGDKLNKRRKEKSGEKKKKISGMRA